MEKSRMMFLCCLIAGCVFSEVTVTNLVVAQRPGTKLMDITYDVSSTTTNQVWVSLTVSNDASVVNAITLTGDISGPVATGTGKSIVWDMEPDWNGNSAMLTYALKADETPPPPEGMVQIPGGTNAGTDPDFGAYSLTVESFYMDATEVTKAQWDEVYNWATHADRDANVYIFHSAGSGEAANHPVYLVNWYDCVKWCNARSEKEGRTPVYTVSGSVYRIGHSSPTQNTSANGYRLPTSAEWEYAARGGLSSQRFPWGDTITHSQANYHSLWFAGVPEYSYDVNAYGGHHPSYATGSYYTSPAGSFAANAYGLYDMAGNVGEWCWDASGSGRPVRGGSWDDRASHLRCGYAFWGSPGYAYSDFGFRAVCR